MLMEPPELELQVLLDSLTSTTDATIAESAVTAAERLLQATLSTEIRDVDWPQSIYETLWQVLYNCWRQLIVGRPPMVAESLCIMESSIWRTLKALSTFPEYDYVQATTRNTRLNAELINALLQRSLLHMLCGSGSSNSSVSSVSSSSSISSSSVGSQIVTKQCIHWIYQNRTDLRAVTRRALCDTILLEGPGRGRSKDAGSSRDHVGPLLEVLLCVVEGLQASQDNSALLRELTAHVLLPLHCPNEMVEWRDQIPVLQRYHEPLVLCLAAVIEKSSSTGLQEDATNVFVGIITGIISTWPASFSSNTPKEVLLLHEMETLLALASAEQFGLVAPLFLQRVPACVGADTENFRTMQRALQIFKNTQILALFGSAPPALREALFASMIPALYRGGKLSWNPTVNKMTALVLKNLRGLDAELFVRFADDLIGRTAEAETQSMTTATGTTGTDTHTAGDNATSSSVATGLKRARPPAPAMVAGFGDLRTGRGGLAAVADKWNPRTGGPPPLGITGVAPWAMGPSYVSSFSPMTTAVATTGAPPAAGGAMPMHTHMPMLPPIGRPHPPPHQQATMPAPMTAIGTSAEGEGQGALSVPPAPPSPARGYQTLLAYMEQCLPSPSIASSSGGPGAGGADVSDDWKTLQAAPTPTLLPSLKFHDLVFGHELGRGSFGTVKYARHIARERTRSEWPEYAVKVISCEKLDQEGYHASVTREMAVLQLLSHPGIARLVSAFRYNASAYLVLEYCGRGDLHTLVISGQSRAGGGRRSRAARGTTGPVPLDHLCTRFIVGEIAAALLSLHDMGFSYNDLKPENVLITELGHVKVADFGACRAQTRDAHELLNASTEILSIEKLRNGDWREEVGGNACSGRMDVEGGDDDGPAGDEGARAVAVAVADNRVEGTPAYLPPEVLRGTEAPSFLSDAWALGCVASFCCRGRPLYTGTAQDVLRQMGDEGGGQGHGETDGGQHVQFAGAPSASATADEDAQGASTSLDAAAAVAFIEALLHRDPHRRMTMRDAIDHDYLIKGRIDGENDEDGLLTMQPMKLHFHTPAVELPRVDPSGGGSGGGDAEEELWARRQFSSLWAPMPSEYIGGGEGSEAAAGRHPLTTYRLTTIDETETERGAVFWRQEKPPGVQ